MKLPAASASRRKSPKSIRRKDSPDSVRTSGGTSAESPSDEVRARIAAMAYELYRQRGGDDGHDLADWLAAERRIVSDGQAGAETNGRP